MGWVVLLYTFRQFIIQLPLLLLLPPSSFFFAPFLLWWIIITIWRAKQRKEKTIFKHFIVIFTVWSLLRNLDMCWHFTNETDVVTPFNSFLTQQFYREIGLIMIATLISIEFITRIFQCICSAYFIHINKLWWIHKLFVELVHFRSQKDAVTLQILIYWVT